MDFDELYPGKFMKAGTFARQMLTCTIKRIYKETMEGEDGGETKVVMVFDEQELPLILAKINAFCIKEMFCID